MMNTVQDRIRYFREEVKGMSMREFQRLVNAELAEPDQVSLGTISNYERTPEPGKRRASPRAEVLAAMGSAFPELRLPWLLMGEGEPTEMAHRVAAGQPLDEVAHGGGGAGSLAARVLERFPDLELLSPEASALFTGVLTRYAMGEPGMDLSEAQLMELAADLRWLLFLPLSQWGFNHQPDYDRFSAYAVALLHALALALPPSGRGDPIRMYDHATVRRLRESVTVGF